MALNFLNIKRKQSGSIPPPPLPEELPLFPEPKELGKPSIEELRSFAGREQKPAPLPPLPSLHSSKLEEPMPRFPSFEEPELLPTFPTLKTPNPKLSSIEEFESRIVRKEKKELSTLRSASLPPPLFMKMTDFRSIMQDLSGIKNRFSEADSMLTRLEELNTDQERALTKWQSAVKDTHNKLIFVDKMLFKGR